MRKWAGDVACVPSWRAKSFGRSTWVSVWMRVLPRPQKSFRFSTLSAVSGVSKSLTDRILHHQVALLLLFHLGVTFKISGTAGHGSLLLPNTAGEKLLYILEKMMGLRKQQVQRLENNPELTIGDVTTINLTRIGGGVQSNVVPPLLTAGFDCRLSLDVNHEEFEAQVRKKAIVSYKQYRLIWNVTSVT